MAVNSKDPNPSVPSPQSSSSKAVETKTNSQTPPPPTSSEQEPPDQGTPNKFAGYFWICVLSVYLALFAATGYVAFFIPDPSPPVDQIAQSIGGVTDETTKAFIINMLNSEVSGHVKKVDLATQSFNIVLGAILGFLSASATNIMTNRGASKNSEKSNVS